MPGKLPPHYTFRPVVGDQHTAARAYFLCVIGLLLAESLLRLPGWIQSIRNRGKFTRAATPALSTAQRLTVMAGHVSRRRRNHWKPHVWLHKLLTHPSPAPSLTDHHAASIIRCLIFIGLNILFGWNRLRFTTDYQSFGWMTIANAGLALLLPTRNNLFSLVTRIPAPVLLMYHRWAGVATVVHATLHFGLTAERYIHGEQFSVVVENARIRVGIMAWAALVLVFLTSLRILRRRAFELFYFAHFLFLVFVAGALYHAAAGPEFLLPGLCLWAVDRAWRLWNNFGRVVTVQSVTYHHAGDVVKVRFAGVKTRYPAQMAWIQLPSVSVLNWHPFTIASAPGDETGTVAIRALGRYTKKAQKLDAGQDMEIAKENVYAPGGNQHAPPQSSQLIMRLDGPYGVGNPMWTRHPVVVLVAGGIGITPEISIASHIVKEALRLGCLSGQRHVYLLWSVSDGRHPHWFEDELINLAEVASRHDVPISLNISIHVTNGRAGKGVMTGKEEQGIDGDNVTYKGPGEIHEGRPDVVQWFQQIREATVGSDVAVSVCGPQSLKNAVRRAAARVSSKECLFFVEEEVFEL